jgi:hypothetical protein
MELSCINNSWLVKRYIVELNNKNIERKYMELVLTNIVFAAKTSIPMTHYSDHSNSLLHQLTLGNNYQLWLTTFFLFAPPV